MDWVEIPHSPVGQHQKVSKKGGRLLSQVNVVQARVEELGNINENKSSSQKLRFCRSKIFVPGERGWRRQAGSHEDLSSSQYSLSCQRLGRVWTRDIESRRSPCEPKTRNSIYITGGRKQNATFTIELWPLPESWSTISNSMSQPSLDCNEKDDHFLLSHLLGGNLSY